MESHGQPGRIQMTESTYWALSPGFEVESRGLISVKGRGELMTYWLNCPSRPEASIDLQQSA